MCLFHRHWHFPFRGIFAPQIYFGKNGKNRIEIYVFRIVLKWIHQLRKTKANFPSTIFQSARIFVQWLSADVPFGTFIRQIWFEILLFALLIGQAMTCPQWKFVLRAPVWLYSESVRVIFSIIFVVPMRQAIQKIKVSMTYFVTWATFKFKLLKAEAVRGCCRFVRLHFVIGF